MPLKTRFFYLLIGWLPTCVIYVATGTVKADSWVVPESGIETCIPFNPHGIWIYLSFYIYIPYTFLTANMQKIKMTAFAFIITGIISGIIFLVLPSSVIFPAFETDGISAYLLDFIAENDTPQNCFPSMHGSLITLCTLANWDKTRRIKSYGCVLFTVMMYYSIIQVRRHVFIDLAAGVLLAVIVWQLSRIIWNRFRQPYIHP